MAADTPSPDALRERVIAALRTVHDPEIPVNIYDLGLIYAVDIDGSGVAKIRMTLTSPNCPVADKLPAEVQRQARAVAGITDATVDLVFDPSWDPSMMSEVAQVELEAMGIDPRRAKETAGQRFAPLTIGRKPDRRQDGHRH